MPHTFRFSPKPNRAPRIPWRPWTRVTFSDAADRGTPVLLCISAAWSHFSHHMDETTWSDEAVHEIVRDRLTAVRVDADREPHVFGRYGGNVPTTAFLTPTGEVLWAGTLVDPEQLVAVATSVLDAWSQRREELELEIARRRRALDTARAQRRTLGLVRRDAADDIASALRVSFDDEVAGFREADGVPQPRVIELFHARAAVAGDAVIADRLLDAMAAGDLHDRERGGFFRAAEGARWSGHDPAKLLGVNAALLEAYAHGAVARGRGEWADVARGIVSWAERELARDGLYGASQTIDRDAGTATTDDTVYTDANAQWIRALARAGARLDIQQWVDRAHDGMLELLRRRRSADGFISHCHDQDTAQPGMMLVDMLECLHATLALAQAAGSAEWLETSRVLARQMQEAFWAVDGGFHDRVSSPDDVGALRYPERQFEQNAAAARALLDLAHITAERTWRGLAERTLSCIGANAVKHGVAAAGFALAIDEYFESPPTVVVAAGDAAAADAAELRRAAFALPLAQLRVWTVPPGHRVGPHRFGGADGSSAHLWTSRGCSQAVLAPEGLAGLATRVR